LKGDDDFDWVWAKNPDTPNGFISIGSSNNGSFRMVEKSAFEKMLYA
jgi:hypothetical protein